ncbi:MAG: hypothetical protein IT285_10045 [Bdellovibrionales bacterium]|nr:hypothetical protein [Bdellovibrionales bacterium]
MLSLFLRFSRLVALGVAVLAAAGLGLQTSASPFLGSPLPQDATRVHLGMAWIMTHAAVDFRAYNVNFGIDYRAEGSWYLWPGVNTRLDLNVMLPLHDQGAFGLRLFGGPTVIKTSDWRWGVWPQAGLTASCELLSWVALDGGLGLWASSQELGFVPSAYLRLQPWARYLVRVGAEMPFHRYYTGLISGEWASGLTPGIQVGVQL